MYERVIVREHHRLEPPRGCVLNGGDDLAKASGACIEAQYVATPLLQA